MYNRLAEKIENPPARASLRTGAVAIATLLSLLSMGNRILGQANDSPNLEFEVASVKPSTSRLGAPGTFQFLPDGTLRVTNMPLRDVIRVAYGLQSFQMNEWPDWLSRSYFDIQAKTSGNPNQDQRLTMLRQLLATRFKLTAHWQTGQGPSYELMPARDDRALGNKIVRSKADCAALRARLAVNPAPPSPNAPLAVCGIRNLPGRIVALGVSSDILAKTLTDVVRRPVTDGTELSGTFDFEIEYTPDPMPLPSELPPDSRPIDPSGPSIFTAIREQLGLKLADRQQPIQILVIDHVEAPSLN